MNDELEFKRLADVELLEEAPKGATVFAEVNGEVKRVAGGIGGGGGRGYVLDITDKLISLMSSVDGEGSGVSVEDGMLSWQISADEARHIFNEAASKGNISAYCDLTALGEVMGGEGFLSGVYWGTGSQFGVMLTNGGTEGMCVSGYMIAQEQFPVVAIQLSGETGTVMAILPPSLFKGDSL